MSSRPQIDASVRDTLIAEPDIVLEDPALMRALVAANERALGANIVDLRGIAMERLEARLDRLEDTHRSVIAAAYENLAGTNQIHRAVLRLLDSTKFEVFLRDLAGDVADTLRVDVMKLVLESDSAGDEPAVRQMGDVLVVAEPGYGEGYITKGRDIPVRQVTLRQVAHAEERVYGEKADYVRSEAVLKLDFGEGRRPGLLVMGSEDPHLFTPQHGTDLLTFFAGVFERSMRRWLS